MEALPTLQISLPIPDGSIRIHNEGSTYNGSQNRVMDEPVLPETFRVQREVGSVSWKTFRVVSNDTC